MGFTSNFTHTIADGIEQYEFRSEVNPRQLHYVDSMDGGPWELSIVNYDDTLSLHQAMVLKSEIEALCEFMAKLTVREIRRNTEPGEPDLAGRGGGL